MTYINHVRSSMMKASGAAMTLGVSSITMTLGISDASGLASDATIKSSKWPKKGESSSWSLQVISEVGHILGSHLSGATSLFPLSQSSYDSISTQQITELINLRPARFWSWDRAFITSYRFSFCTSLAFSFYSFCNLYFCSLLA